MKGFYQNLVLLGLALPGFPTEALLSKSTCRTSAFITPSSRLSASVKTALTEETDWTLRFLLKGVSTSKGKKVDEIFSVRAHFLEDQGYEPPQGSLQQIDDDNNLSRLKISSSRWKLSEDPNDRKDGLWVWGLFEEPLYPFLLLQLETEAIPIPGSNEDFILPLRLYAQINHKRDDTLGVVLEGAELKVRKMETIQADMFGAAQAEVYDEVSIGTLSIRPPGTTSSAPKVGAST